jgi:hypothetical protein
MFCLGAVLSETIFTIAIHMILVTLCCATYVGLIFLTNQPQRPVTGSLNKSSCLAPTLGVTKFINMLDINLVTIWSAT